MKTKTFVSIITLLALFAVGCSGPGDTSSDSDSGGEFTFCEDDSSFFDFSEDETLKDAIDALPLGLQTNDVRNDILDILGTNDGLANHVEYSLEVTTDYDTIGVLDDDRDFFGQYSKEVTRFDSEKILNGTYDIDENYYDESESVEVTTDLTANYQVFRNGFCPSISRYYEIYDFPGTTDDVALEKVYGTENYIRTLYLVGGQARALELNTLYADYTEDDSITSLTYAATKFLSNASGEVDSEPTLNTSKSLEIVLIASYDPSGEALGEKALHTVLIVDGMVKKMRDFSGTYEIVVADEIYRTVEMDRTAVYSVEDVGAFSGTLLDPENFSFSNTHPNL
jgi:hypothetical protein